MINETALWFAAAKQQPNVPTYDPKQVCFYLGMQIEEMAEKLSLLAAAFGGDPKDSEMMEDLNDLANMFKSQDARIVDCVDAAIRANPEEWLDADADLVWVSIGAIRAAGIEPRLIYGEVARANWEKKFPDGAFHHDGNGKVLKPQDWRAPDHSRFVAHLKLTPEN